MKRFQLTPEDFEEFTGALVHGAFDGKLHQVQYPDFFPVVTLGAVCVAALAFFLAGMPAMVLGITVGAIVVSLVRSLEHYLMRRLALERSAPLPEGTCYSPRSVAFSPEGFHITTATLKTYQRWEGILKVAETDRLYLLFTDRHVAYIFPKDALESEMERMEIRQRLTPQHRPSGDDGSSS